MTEETKKYNARCRQRIKGLHESYCERHYGKIKKRDMQPLPEDYNAELFPEWEFRFDDELPDEEANIEPEDYFGRSKRKLKRKIKDGSYGPRKKKKE